MRDVVVVDTVATQAAIRIMAEVIEAGFPNSSLFGIVLLGQYNTIYALNSQ